mmetsp:Transcript_38994/g.90726  ORF Transcript_38994/g.90726 Transcript_38994/m.90726 type:complete len:298 (-) Transcript_38994:1562-2455(-)
MIQDRDHRSEPRQGLPRGGCPGGNTSAAGPTPKQALRISVPRACQTTRPFLSVGRGRVCPTPPQDWCRPPRKRRRPTTLPSLEGREWGDCWRDCRSAARRQGKKKATDTPARPPKIPDSLCCPPLWKKESSPPPPATGTRPPFPQKMKYPPSRLSRRPSSAPSFWWRKKRPLPRYPPPPPRPPHPTAPKPTGASGTPPPLPFIDTATILRPCTPSTTKTTAKDLPPSPKKSREVSKTCPWRRPRPRCPCSTPTRTGPWDTAPPGCHDSLLSAPFLPRARVARPTRSIPRRSPRFLPF